MSTKTSIKRIALVAVSALGFGLLSVVPASADNSAGTASISPIRVSYVGAVQDVVPAAEVTLTADADWDDNDVDAAASPTLTVALTTAPSAAATITIASTAYETATDGSVTLADDGVVTDTDSSTNDAAGALAAGLTFSADISGTYIGTITIDGKEGTDLLVIPFSFTTTGAVASFDFTVDKTSTAVSGAVVGTVTLRDAAGNITQPQTVDAFALSDNSTGTWGGGANLTATEMFDGTGSETFTQPAVVSTTTVLTATPQGTLIAAGLTAKTVSVVTVGTMSVAIAGSDGALAGVLGGDDTTITDDEDLTATVNIPAVTVPTDGTATETASQTGRYNRLTGTLTAGVASDTIRLTATSNPAVAVTYTTSTGSFVSETAPVAWNAGLTTLSVASGTQVYIYATKVGLNTVTVSAGGATSTVRFWAYNVATDYYTIAATGTPTTLAKEEIGQVNVSVTDVFGNPVDTAAGLLRATAAGRVILGGNNFTQDFETNAAGTAQFSILSDDVNGTGTITIAPALAGANAWLAGYTKPVGAADPVSSVVVTFTVDDGSSGYSRGSLTASVGDIPFAGEASGNVASFDYSAVASAGSTAEVSVNLTQKPSGSTLTNSDIVLADVNADAETTFTGRTMTIVSGDASPEASVNISFGGKTLIAGTYTLTITPAASAGGAVAQTVSFTVTGRVTDEARLTSVSTAVANRFGGVSATGTVKDPVVVVAGGTVADAPAAASTIRLRADLITFPTGGYVNTFASAPASVALGQFPGTTSATAAANSNLVTYLGVFAACSPTNAAHKAATYTTGTNTISAAAGCDIVAARAGSASTTTPLNATGAAAFSFTPTVAGTYVLRVWQDANNDGILNVNEVRSEQSIVVSAYTAFSAAESTSYINAVSPSSTTGVAASKVTSCTATYPAAQGTYVCDETVLAPKGSLTAPVKVARIKVTLNDADGVALDSRSTFSVVTATITGPGNVAIDATGAAATPVGRVVLFTPTALLTNAGGPETFYVNVFNDGNAGAANIEIKIGTTVLATETLKFYGPVATVTATQGRKVLPALTGTYGCVTSTTACDSTTVAKTPAVKLVAADANGTPVPYRTYTATSSVDTVFGGIATAAAGTLVSEATGSAWYPVSVLSGSAVKSGASGTLTFSTAGETATSARIAASPLTFSLGGTAASASLAISGGKNIGDKATMTFTVKDAAGNAAFDNDHALSLKSNIALTTAINQLAAAANALAVIGGESTLDFYNPLVAGSVNVDALIDGLLAVSASSVVTNAAQDASNEAIGAAQDAAAEAIDAANAATDAANLAAEAADAATVAAEEARDAADAATAAVEELATQVATLMAALKAQITTLANTVAKIAKKVRA